MKVLRTVNSAHCRWKASPGGIAVGWGLGAALVPLVWGPSIASAGRSYQCPGEMGALTELMVRDLTTYANLVAQRRRRKLDPHYNSYAVVGQTSLQPLAMANPEYPVARPRALPHQLFLTSLEKQYRPGPSFTEIQRFHWLFLTRSDRGWNLVAMYSRVGSSDRDPLLLPPTESSTTPLGEAVTIWLRDCNAGQVRP